mgnify:CR=1 FL=1
MMIEINEIQDGKVAHLFTKKRVYTALCILGWGLLFAVLGVPGPNWNTELQARLSDTGAAK